jgi:hypothetical protein
MQVIGSSDATGHAQAHGRTAQRKRDINLSDFFFKTGVDLAQHAKQV